MRGARPAPCGAARGSPRPAGARSGPALRQPERRLLPAERGPSRPRSARGPAALRPPRPGGAVPTALPGPPRLLSQPQGRARLSPRRGPDLQGRPRPQRAVLTRGCAGGVVQTIPAGLRVPGAAGSAPGPHLGEPAASARTGGERETKKKKKGKKRKRGGGGLKKKKGGEGKGGEGCAAHTPTTGALGRRSCAPSAPAPPRGAPLYMASRPPPPTSAPPPPRPPAERRPPRPSRPRPHPPGPAPPLALPHRRGSSALYVSARLASRQSCVTARVNACPRQSLPSRPSAPQGGGRDPLRTTAPITAAAMAPRSWEPPIAARRRLGRLAARRVQRRALQPPPEPCRAAGAKNIPRR